MAFVLSLLPVFDWVLRTSAKVSILIIVLLLVKLLFSTSWQQPLIPVMDRYYCRFVVALDTVQFMEH